VYNSQLFTFTARLQLKATKSGTGTGGLASPSAFLYYSFRAHKPARSINDVSRRVDNSKEYDHKERQSLVSEWCKFRFVPLFEEY